VVSSGASPFASFRSLKKHSDKRREKRSPTLSRQGRARGKKGKKKEKKKEGSGKKKKSKKAGEDLAAPESYSRHNDQD